MPRINVIWKCQVCGKEVDENGELEGGNIYHPWTNPEIDLCEECAEDLIALDADYRDRLADILEGDD